MEIGFSIPGEVSVILEGLPWRKRWEKMVQKARNTGIIVVSPCAESDSDVSENNDEVRTGRENGHFAGQNETAYEKAQYLTLSVKVRWNKTHGSGHVGPNVGDLC